MAEERTKALRDFLVASPRDSNRKWAEYVALAPDLAGFLDPKHGPESSSSASPAAHSTASSRVLRSATPTSESSLKRDSTKDDLSPGARRMYDYLIGATNELHEPAATTSSPTSAQGISTTVDDLNPGATSTGGTIFVGGSVSLTLATSQRVPSCASSTGGTPASVAATAAAEKDPHSVTPSTCSKVCMGADTTMSSTSAAAVSVSTSTRVSISATSLAGASIPPASVVSEVSIVPRDSTALNVEPIAVDIKGTECTTAEPTNCSSECPSHDAVVRVAVHISSAAPTSTTTIGDVLFELAAHVECSTDGTDGGTCAEIFSSVSARQSATTSILMLDDTQPFSISPAMSIFVCPDANDDMSQNDQGLLSKELVQFTDSNGVAPTLMQVKAQSPGTRDVFSIPMSSSSLIFMEVCPNSAEKVQHSVMLEKLKPGLALELHLIVLVVMRKVALLWPKFQSTSRDTILLLPWDPGVLMYGIRTNSNFHAECGQNWMVSLVEQHSWPSCEILLLGPIICFERLHEKRIILEFSELLWQHFSCKEFQSEYTGIVTLGDWSIWRYPIPLNLLFLRLLSAVPVHISCSSSALLARLNVKAEVHHILQGNLRYCELMQWSFHHSQQSEIQFSTPRHILFSCCALEQWKIPWPIILVSLRSLFQCYNARSEFLYSCENFQWTIAWSLSYRFSLSVTWSFNCPTLGDWILPCSTRRVFIFSSENLQWNIAGLSDLALAEWKPWASGVYSWELCHRVLAVGPDSSIFLWPPFAIQSSLGSHDALHSSTMIGKLHDLLEIVELKPWPSWELFLYIFVVTRRFHEALHILTSSVISLKGVYSKSSQYFEMSGIFIAPHHLEVGILFVVVMLSLISLLAQTDVLYSHDACIIRWESKMMLWGFANSNDGILTCPTRKLISWDPGGLDPIFAAAWIITQVPPHLTWDPGGYTQHRLEGKLNLKEGGLSATCWPVGRYSWAWPDLKTWELLQIQGRARKADLAWIGRTGRRLRPRAWLGLCRVRARSPASSSSEP